jgi:FemAB-related protein (PEP-CTERM system-associated)
LERAFGHEPFCLEAGQGPGEVWGLLPLALVRSRLFGRFLVSLPYLNSGGVLTDDASVARALIDRAIELADALDVDHLELRHEERVEHPGLGHELTTKVHMRRDLPASADGLWNELPPKVRNQVRKARQHQLTVHWGGRELLRDFYAVFSRNMRDLGTPVYGKRLFQTILDQFPEQAELCVLRAGRQPVAGAVLVHGCGTTEVPSASSLRSWNPTCANMLMYWELLVRAIERRQKTFDFGRSSRDSGTFQFKKQWGAVPSPTCWQYYVRRGSPADLRPESPRYRRRIWIWQHLPVSLTRLIGPPIVRGIP